ncbi:CtsR family transcriptional regulator [Clostridium hydrogeniformans]|uniref:CtsR family transcriptional regulator n=1 Tax=Clostridium hydrogeniformans TaxID=349933 RepID=UPI0004801E3B|nr:CtsR family transcriptional regulator [Clostridium hydrogeniformans]
MARLSDVIEDFIKSLLEENNREIQIQRNELANKFSCAPSQINYVLTTRFTTDKGYVIESRRGGGGYIVIRQIKYNNNNLMMLILNKIGESITYSNSVALIEGIIELGLITEREGEIIKISINERILDFCHDKNRQRALILKSIITVVLR